MAMIGIRNGLCVRMRKVPGVLVFVRCIQKKKSYGGKTFRIHSKCALPRTSENWLWCLALDSAPQNIHRISSQHLYHQLSGLLIVGGLPGFIWGRFHVSDETTVTSFSNLLSVYQLPLIGLVASSNSVHYCFNDGTTEIRTEAN
jgi:hypothetical protein